MLALHALLIGDAHDAEGLVRALDADEEALLRDAITAVYKQCAESRERPREQLLIDALHDRQHSGQLTGANADKLQSLLLRLGPYGHDGTLRTSPTGARRSTRTRRWCCSTSPPL